MLKGKRKLIVFGLAILILVIGVSAGVSIKRRHDTSHKFDKALEEFQKQGDELNNTFINHAATEADKQDAILAQADNYYRTQRYDQALKVLKLIDETQWKDAALAQYYQVLAEIAVAQNQYDKADQYAGQVLATPYMLKSVEGTKYWTGVREKIKQHQDPFTITKEDEYKER